MVSTAFQEGGCNMRYTRSRLEMLCDLLLMLDKHRELATWRLLSYTGLGNKKHLLVYLTVIGAVSMDKRDRGVYYALTDKGTAIVETYQRIKKALGDFKR